MGTDRGRAAVFFGLYAAVLLYSLYWMHLGHVSKRVTSYPLLHTLVGFALVYVAVRAWLVITERVGQSWEPLWIALDLLIISGVVRLTGGTESEAALVYFWPIGTYAILRRPRGTALVGVAVGVCYVAATWPQEFTRDYADKLGSRLFVLALVTIVATAFSVREVQRVEEIARLREQVALGEYRRRLSQEMHDGIQHYLVVIAMRLEWARRLAEREPARAAALAVDQRLVVRQAADELHHLVRRLRSPALERQGFVDALRDHIAMFAERTEMVAPLRVCGEPRTLPPDVEQAAFRIIQEALTNVEKHAHATSASVELDFSGGRLRCVVEDDGKGYDPKTVAPEPTEDGGFGLSSMRERAESVGGTLTITSAPGRGTRVEFVVPIEEAGRPET